MRKGLLALTILGFLLPGLSGKAAETCDRTCLKGFIDQYLAALVAHDPSKLPLAKTVRFTENTHDMKLGDGLWKDATKIEKFRQDIIDTTTHNAGSYFVVDTTSGMPALATLRLKVIDGKITEIETTVTRTPEEGFFFDLTGLEEPSPAMNYVPKPDERMSREDDIRIASYYPRGLEAGSFVKVDAPFTEDAYRRENGRLTAGPACTWNPSCKNIKTQPSPTRPGLHDRLVMVDEQMGLVWHRIDWPRGAGHRLAAWEVFKVYGGKIHAVEAFLQRVPEDEKSGWE
jgi:hypothetical protein